MLIDDMPENVCLFREAGGAAYRFPSLQFDFQPPMLEDIDQFISRQIIRPDF